MEYINSDIRILNSPQLRRIIKEYRQQTLERVPPFSRSRKVVLIDMIRKLDMIEILKKIKDTNLNDAVEEEEETEEETEEEIELPDKPEIKPEPEPSPPPPLKLVKTRSIVPVIPPKSHPDPIRKEVGFADPVETISLDDGDYTDDEDTITQYDLEQSLEDIRYDISYLTKYRPRSDELKELKTQLRLYAGYLKQNYK